VQFVDCGKRNRISIFKPQAFWSVIAEYDSGLDEPELENIGHTINRSDMASVNANGLQIFDLDTSMFSGSVNYRDNSLGTVYACYLRSSLNTENNANISAFNCFIASDFDCDDDSVVEARGVVIGDDLECEGAVDFTGFDVFVRDNFTLESGAGTAVLNNGGILGSLFDADGKLEIQTPPQQELIVTEGPDSVGVRLPFRSESAHYAILDNDGVHTVWATGGAGGINITLPIAVNNPGRRVTVKKVDAGAGAISILPNPADLLDGGAGGPILAAQYDSITVQNDGGSDWYYVASYP
jgi:hypothetical protein